jgi:hypothetical protein
MNKINNLLNQFRSLSCKGVESWSTLNQTQRAKLSQENKNLIVEIFYCTLILIIIIIIIINSPSSGAVLNNIIGIILGIIYPFLETVLNTILSPLSLSEHLFNYLETFINYGCNILNNLKDIFSLIIEHYKKVLMPEVILCESGVGDVEYHKFYKNDLKYIVGNPG